MLADTLRRLSPHQYLVRVFLISLKHLRAGYAVIEVKRGSSQRRLHSHLCIGQCMAAVLCLLLSSLSAADDRLDALVNGTDVTPSISGLQIAVYACLGF